MNAYEALNKAADQIEARPENYDFHTSTIGPVPISYGGLYINRDAACMLGVVGRIAGMPWHDNASDVAHKILGTDTETFYNQIIEAALGAPNNEDKPEGYRALRNPAVVPNAMRKVARERYRDIPPKIKEIFEITNEVA